MQLLEGQTLREMISRNGQTRPPFALPELLNLALQITAALDAAHQHGILHRDIKPANIFVTREGQVKILDFGLAKPTHGETPEGELQPNVAEFTEHSDGDVRRLASMPDALLSRTGVTLGTTAYMSPEQARGEKLDARTDIFSFGLVLYEMATGHRAYEGATEPVLHDAIFQLNPAPVRRTNPTLPAEFERILGKCLERNRDARYPTAGQVRADLEALRVKATRRLTYRSWIAVAVGLALLTTVASMWVALRHATVVPPPNVKVRQLTTNSWENPVTSSALSPDGRYVAYADTKGLHVKLIGSEGSQLVARPEALRDERVDWGVSPYAWFPDSREFIATSHPPIEETPWAPLSSSISTMWVVPVTGGPPHKLRDAAIAWSVSPDGSMIGFGAESGRLGDRELWVMGPKGEQARRILQVEEGRAVCCLSFFQDGKRVSYLTGDDSGDAFVTQDLQGGPVATVMDESAMRTKGDPVWLADGRLIYAECVFVGSWSCTYWIARFDTRSGRLIQGARRLTDVVGASVSSTSATPDGRRVTFIRSTQSGSSYVADMEADATRIGSAAHFTLDESDESITDWSADSRTAIIVSNRGDYSAVYRQKLGTDIAEPIIARNERGLLGTATLSPDAKWIILAVYPLPLGSTPPRPQVWRVPISGGALEQLFSLAPGSGFYCARAPATLCVTAEPTANRKEIVVSAFDPATGVRGSELLRFDRYPNRDEDPAPLAFALSPDGQWVSTSVGPAGPLRILSLRGEPARVLPVRGLNVQQPAAWTPDGRGLIVTTYRDDAAVLLHVDLQGNAQELFKCESAQTCFGIPSPDGKHLGIYQSRRTANIWMLESF